jgi:ribosomal protein S18 acetylase RimI-like enzyme
MQLNVLRSQTIRAPLTVRPAEAADHAAILSVMAAANAEYRPLIPANTYDEYFRGLRELITARPHVRTAVAEQGRQIVGAVALTADGDMADFENPDRWASVRALAVDPAARRRGIGQRLVGWCIGEARQHEAPAICLHSAIFQITAHRLYERLGFKRIPERDLDATTGCPDGGSTAGVPPLLAYWKMLGGLPIWRA